MGDDPDLEIPVHYRYRGHRYRGTKLQSRSCDQCHFDHSRCNRKSPTCSRCLEANLICSWIRPRSIPKNANFDIKNYDIKDTKEKERHYSFIKENINCTKPSGFFLVTKEHINNLNKSIVPKTTRPSASSINPESKLLKNNFDLWNRSTKLRYNFKTFLSTCGLSIKNSSNQNSRIIDIIFASWNLPPKGKELFQTQLTFFKHDIASLTSQAVKAYFYYFNTFFPLFTFTSFYQRPRSKFLKYVIICIGLRYLPCSVLRDQLLTIIEGKIFLKRLSNFRFNLDTIQAILCIYAGLNWSSIGGMNYSLFRVSIYIMYSIGLHRCFYHKDPGIFLERTLAFNNINYLSTVFFIDLVPMFNLQGISKSKVSKKIPTSYFNSLSKITSIHQPLDNTQLEYFYLVITEQLQQSSCILNEVSEAFVIGHKENLSLVLKAEIYILKLLEFGQRRLLKLGYINPDASSSDLLLSSNLTTEFRSPSFFELVHTLRVRLCFDILRLLDLILKTKYTELSKVQILNLYRKVLRYSTFVIKGLAAINPEAPFVFYRPYMNLYSIRMAIEASIYCNFKSVKQLIDLSHSIFQSQSKHKIYAYAATIQKELLLSLSKSIA